MNFYWKAYYKDGSTFSLKDECEGSHYKKIDRANLAKFSMVEEVSGNEYVALHFTRPTQRLICRCRTAKHFCAESGTSLGEERVWLVGWQETKKGSNYQLVLALFESGAVEVAPGFINGVPWLNSSINFMPEEKA